MTENESETMNELQNVLERVSKRLDDADEANEAALKAAEAAEKRKTDPEHKIDLGATAGLLNHLLEMPEDILVKNLKIIQVHDEQ